MRANFFFLRKKVTGFCRSPQETRKSSPTGSVTSSVSNVMLTPSRQLTDAEKLRKVISELVDTERSYVKVCLYWLNLFVSFYHGVHLALPNVCESASPCAADSEQLTWIAILRDFDCVIMWFLGRVKITRSADTNVTCSCKNHLMIVLNLQCPVPIVTWTMSAMVR